MNFKASYNWLNNYYDGKLPKLDDFSRILTMNSSEVDGVEENGDDFLLDIKVLPSLAHSCLCHRGIAREYGALSGNKPKKYSRDFSDYKVSDTKGKLIIKISEDKLCRRYIGRLVENIKVGPSPLWLKEKIESVGQRSISNVVDATNFVMLELGQPMHAFDADKLKGLSIDVKKAVKGDYLKTLDGKDVELDTDTLLITNDNIPLAIAGIKGGVHAEVDENTKNIILESANFDPVNIRKTAQRINIKTDASKRYENEISPEIAFEAMDILTKIINEVANTQDTKIAEIVDIYPGKVDKYKVSITTKEASSIIGIDFNDKDLENVFEKFDFEYNKNSQDGKYVVTIPDERLDIRIKEDLAEEIGRIYGYDKLKDIELPKTDIPVKLNKNFYYANKIREIMGESGFSEVNTYTFVEKGDLELENPMSPDKKYLRTNLSDSIKNALELNARYSELIGMPQIKIYELSHVFDKIGEHSRFVIGVKTPVGVRGLPKDMQILNDVLEKLKGKINFNLEKINSEENVAEFDFEKMIANLSEPSSYDYKITLADDNLRFKKISNYPFMIRDVAVFVPEGIEQEEVFDLILKEAGPLVVKSRIFDVFTKKLPDGSSKTSYAFRLIFQSYEKTLSDVEVNEIMSRVTDMLNSNTGWQVR